MKKTMTPAVEMPNLKNMDKDLRNRVDHTVAPVEYTVDAKGRTLGRVASEAASALLGKKSVFFLKNKVLPVQVTILNAAQLKLPENRVSGKSYIRYTGYPGGLRETSMTQMMEKKGIEEVVRLAVDGMIPRNKLRKERMKRLTIIN